jgi:hypothetical protein
MLLIDPGHVIGLNFDVQRPNIHMEEHLGLWFVHHGFGGEGFHCGDCRGFS